MLVSPGRRRGPSAASTRQAVRERGQQSRAEQRLADRRLAAEALQTQLEEELEQIELDFEPATLNIEAFQVPPRKSDIAVDEVQLVWLPWRVDGTNCPTNCPAY